MKGLIKTQTKDSERKRHDSNNCHSVEYTTKSTTQLKIILSRQNSQRRDLINSTLQTEFILKILRKKTSMDCCENILKMFVSKVTEELKMWKVPHVMFQKLC